MTHVGRPCGVGLSSCRTLEPESNEKVDAAAECCDAATLRPALPVAPLLLSSWQWAGLGDGLEESSKEIAEQGVVALPAVLAELVLKALIAESVAWSSSRGEGVSRTASSSCSASIAFCSRLV